MLSIRNLLLNHSKELCSLAIWIVFFKAQGKASKEGTRGEVYYSHSCNLCVTGWLLLNTGGLHACCGVIHDSSFFFFQVATGFFLIQTNIFYIQMATVIRVIPKRLYPLSFKSVRLFKHCCSPQLNRLFHNTFVYPRLFGLSNTHSQIINHFPDSACFE